MYHSLLIGRNIIASEDGKSPSYINTWSDWHLIPATRPLVAPPSPKLSMIEIPGADGTLDLTESLTGRALFGDRTGSWEFFVENGYKSWSSLYSEIMSYLHGKRLEVVLEDDAAYWYEGRLSVNQWRSDPYHSKIVIDYTLGPYKRYSLTGKKGWLWDTFNFETGIIQSYRNLVVKVNKDLKININGDLEDSELIVECNNSNVTLNITTTKATSTSTTRIDRGTFNLLKGTTIGTAVDKNMKIFAKFNNELTFTCTKERSDGTPTKVTIRVEGGLL